MRQEWLEQMVVTKGSDELPDFLLRREGHQLGGNSIETVIFVQESRMNLSQALNSILNNLDDSTFDSTSKSFINEYPRRRDQDHMLEMVLFWMRVPSNSRIMSGKTSPKRMTHDGAWIERIDRRHENIQHCIDRVKTRLVVKIAMKPRKFDQDDLVKLIR